LISNQNFSYVKDDIRTFDKKILKDVYCVFDLASLSNDPAGELDQSKTLEINHKGRVRVAQLCKNMGVKRYFLASTCSIYGFNENICDETSTINPLTTYAKASSMAEKEILGLADDKFCTTAFRFATIYGISKRMRFDLVVNTMTLSLFENQKIIVNGGGNQERPLVDVRDTCQAYLLGINADEHLVNGQIFNVGSNEQNYKIVDLANEIGKALNLDYQIISKGDPDYRSYRIDFSKIKNGLSFRPNYTPAKSAIEIFAGLKDGSLDHGIKTKTVDWYLHMLNNDSMSL
jgi:nucleoside-diphosphate-sugar epimerase